MEVEAEVEVAAAAPAGGEWADGSALWPLRADASFPGL